MWKNNTETSRIIVLLALCSYGLHCSSQSIPDTISKRDSVSTSWNLIWSDEFNGSVLDTTNWNIREAKPGWVNNELQTYVKEGTIAVKDGSLVITAKKSGEEYLSGRINSYGKQWFQYGKIEFRAKLPKGNGLWPALWMLGNNIEKVGWPRCGELDIMEHVGKTQNTVYATVHNKMAHGAHEYHGSLEVASASDAFHRYTMYWDAEKIDFYVDDTLSFSYQPLEKTEENWPYDQPFYLIINLAVGGNWPGFDIEDELLPQTLEVDYVRVYQSNH
ncbi:glycoside hydrolase family 16 protein [Flagellimonas meridianipacifica]|nr:glycoside hydrolase family 16 protein [Allomuricauda pacifica]